MSKGSKGPKGLVVVGAAAGVYVAGKKFLTAWDERNAEGDSVSGAQAIQFGVALIFAVSVFVVAVKAA